MRAQQEDIAGQTLYREVFIDRADRNTLGLLDNGTLNVSSTTVADNRGNANGKDGSFAQGGGIWNGQLFGGEFSALTLTGSSVTGNRLSGSPGATLQGGGIFNLGPPKFTVTLTNTVVAHNAPDQCHGC